jgi:hypothetical protein
LWRLRQLRAKFLDWRAFQATENDLQRLQATTGLLTRELVALGKVAIADGCVQDLALPVYQFLEDSSEAGFREVSLGWDEIDGTVAQSDEDDELRYIRGPTNHQNSCSIDVTWNVATILNLWRVQHDQLPGSAVDQLGLVSTLMRAMQLSPLGQLSDKQIQQSRDLLARSLQLVNPSRFPSRLFHMWVLEDVLEECLQGAPQLTFTWTLAQRCCDGRVRPSSAPKICRSTGIKFHEGCQVLEEPMTGTDGLNMWFKGEKRLDFVSTCSRGKACTQKVVSQRVIIDRLPPMLMVNYTGGVNDDQRLRMVGSHQVVYYLRNAGLQTVNYRAVGVVLQLGLNHFVTRWRNDLEEVSAEWVEWDGIKSARCRVINGWNSGLLHKGKGPVRMADDAFIAAVFYKIVETEE